MMLNGKNWKHWLLLLLRIGFGLMLIAASIDKIRHPMPFAEVVENYRVLGEGLSRWTAVIVPCMELLVGILLLIGVWSDAAITVNVLLMFTFLILVLQAYIRGLDIDCGCFFVEGESKIGILKIIENTLFLLGSIVLYRLYSKQRGNDGIIS
ncbi:hypothetical protein BVY01_03600 [bacterium I07]|nr:hypothetical protein BVY01_03600 [bacterium I07]